MAGTFINGLHETCRSATPKALFGLAETGQTMISAPDFRTLRVFINVIRPFEVGCTEMLRDDLRLDFREGTLISQTLWRTAEGHRVAVTARTMISFSDRPLGAAGPARAPARCPGGMCWFNPR